MEKHIIYDSDFEELFYYEHQHKFPRIIWGNYRSDPENIQVVLQIDKNDLLEKCISMIKEFLKDIGEYQQISKTKLLTEYSVGETPIQVGRFIGVFYENKSWGLQYTDFEEQGLKLLAIFDMNGEFIKTDISF